MNPARWSSGRPRVVVLATLLLVLYGVLSYQGLPRQENPTIAERFATIVVYLAGAEPERVEILVTKVIEDKIAELDDIDTLFSRSYDGVSWTLVEVREGAPQAERLQQIRDKVQQARALLPAGASDPDVDTRTFKTNTLLVAVTGAGVDPLVLRRQAKELKRDVQQLPDVRRVEWLGEPREEIEVALDLRRLSQRGVSVPRVIEALRARNVELPSGEIEAGGLRSALHTTGAFDAASDVGASYLGAGPDGLPIRLADVARVTRHLEEPDVLARAGGDRAVILAIEMLPERNAIAFGERVRALLARWEVQAPEGMQAVVAADEPTYVRERLSLLTRSLLLGMGLVVALALVGMGWRSGFVVSLSIPLSLTVAVALLGAVNLPLHQISIAALVIAIGLVVDEAIIVTDNIQRHVDRGKSPRDAAIDGLGEIHLAILAGAATTLAAFIPLWLMVGDIGDFIRSIPLTVTAMLVGSVAVAHFVTPLLAAAMHRGLGARRGRSAPSRLGALYRRLLPQALERPRWLLAGFALGLLGAGLLGRAVLWPMEFFPDADRRQFLIKVELPSGTPVEETSALMAAIEARLAEHPEVADWTTVSGAEMPKFYYNEFDDGRAENVGRAIVNTRAPVDRTREVAMRVHQDLASRIAGARIRTRVLRQGYSGAEDIEIFITGDDLDVLRELARRVREIVRALPGTTQVRDNFGYDPITVQAHVDDAKANLLGITHLDVATTLHTAIEGVVATTFREGDEEIDVVVRTERAHRRTAAELRGLPVHSTTLGVTVPFSHVASLEPGWTTREIMRYDRKREAMVEADLAPGFAAIEVASQAERAVRQQIALPPGYRLHFMGQRKEVNESLVSMAKATLLAIFLIYIILVLRFGSLLQPVLILLAIPMAVIGSTFGLVATGSPLGFMALLGMIALSGIVVNDSIVLVDYVNTLRSRGMALREAVLEGAATRLRAVTMTSLTTMTGLLPLSLSGGDFWGPFGYAMIFGLGASTVLTLVIQPAAYLALERRRAGGLR